MKKNRLLVVLMLLIAMLLMTGVVFAQDDGTDDGTTEGEIPTEPIEGTVIGVNLEAGTVDILKADGTIVTISITTGEYTHPIVQLLGTYFAGAGINDWAEALETLETEAGTVVAIIETVDENGNPVWEVTYADGTTGLIDDPEQAETLAGALETLVVTLEGTVDEETGELIVTTDAGEEIQAYHEDGFGFGVLVKLYAIAGNGDISIEELTALFKSGVGMGQIFKEYGKPDLLGVGHVKQALRGDAKDRADKADKENGNNKDKDKETGKPDDTGKPADKEDKGNNGKGKDK